MKKLQTIIALTIILTSCNLLTSEIDGEKVNFDENTHQYTLKEDGSKVTGTVVIYDVDPKTSEKYKHILREVKDSKRLTGKEYYSNGKLYAQYSFDENGLQTGTINFYSENGKLNEVAVFKNGKRNGISKRYFDNGNQAMEVQFENGLKIKEYIFDESGKKIIPAIDKLELVTYQTGFYEYTNMNSYQVLYQPMVIMKWKNISNEPVTETIEMEGVFISEGEEWAKASNYFQIESEAPLQPQLSRQSVLQSSVGYKNYNGISNSIVSCQILINKQIYKTVKIKNDLLRSNRIQ